MILPQVFAASVVTLSLTVGPALQHVTSEIALVSATGTEGTLANSRLGCRTVDIWTDAARMGSSDKYLLDKLKAGDCTLLPVGPVRIDESSPEGQASGQSCVRPAGFNSCWWIPDEFLK